MVVASRRPSDCALDLNLPRCLQPDAFGIALHSTLTLWRAEDPRSASGLDPTCQQDQADEDDQDADDEYGSGQGYLQTGLTRKPQVDSSGQRLPLEGQSASEVLSRSADTKT